MKNLQPLDKTLRNRLGRTIKGARDIALSPVPITQSPADAVFLIFGLQTARAQKPWQGFGASPGSTRTTYENGLYISSLLPESRF